MKRLTPEIDRPGAWTRISLLVLVALAFAALGATPSQAAATELSGPPNPRAHTAAVEEEQEEAEEESEEEIEVELEFEEGEEEDGGSLPPECLLRSAEPRVVARFDHGDLRLRLRYTAELPLRASVAYWLKGSKGSARLGSATRLLGNRGVLQLHSRVDGRTLAKLHAARVIVVQLAVPNTPGYCKRLLTMHLTPRRPLRRGATWYEPS